mgnify:CR=1 FL=1
MKIKFLIFYASIIFTSCTNDDYIDIIKGSWFSLNKEANTYEEIHIDDSLFIYCHDNCNVLLTYNYSIEEDSIYLFLNENDIESRYQILFDKSNGKVMYLKNRQKKLVFKRIDSTYENLNDFLVGFESLDSLCLDYHQRKRIVMQTLNATR